MTQRGPKRLFPIGLHHETSGCKMVDNLFFKPVNPSEMTRFNIIIESIEFDNIWKAYERAA